MTTIQNYLKNQWPTFYGNSQLKNYFLSLGESKDYISAGKVVKSIDGESVSIFEVDRYLESSNKEEELLFESEIAGFLGLE
jgi:hypothetical protein